MPEFEIIVLGSRTSYYEQKLTITAEHENTARYEALQRVLEGDHAGEEVLVNVSATDWYKTEVR